MRLQRQAAFIHVASKVKNIIEDNKISDYPVPIIEIINKDKGVTLLTLREFAKLTDLSIRDAALAGGSAEAFHFSKGAMKFIVYNDEVYHRRMRFTLAHEYGHYILKHQGKSLYDSEPAQESLEEYEADVFASCLLFPLDMRYRLKDEERTDEIVKCLDISHAAAEMAMRELKLHIREGLDKYISSYKHNQLSSYLTFLKEKYQGRLEYIHNR